MTDPVRLAGPSISLHTMNKRPFFSPCPGGWQVFESVNLSLVVGLAVDYVVHLAEGYHAAPARDRLGRTHHMLEQVGVSILSGALTTLGASMFMFAAVMVFFVQVSGLHVFLCFIA